MRSRVRTALFSGVALLAGATLAVWLIARDEAPPDISDLPETRLALPESENAFSGLLAVAQTLSARAKSDEALSAALAESTLARERDPDQLARIYSATSDLIAPWREACARPRSSAPAYNGKSDRAPYEFIDMHRLARLAALWCAPPAHGEAGGLRDRVGRIADALRAARHVTESYDTLIVYLTGIAATNLVLGELADALRTEPPDPDHARQLIAALEQARLDREQLVAILRNEAHFTVNYARDSNLEKHMEGMAAVGIPRPPAGAAFFYKPNQSARWQIEALRSGLAQLDTLPISSLVVPKPDRGSATILFGLPHPDNAFGRHYAANELVDFSHLLRLRQLLNARLSAMQALVAIQAERAVRHGELPASLDELAPAYFERVPVDSADGAPIRYSREHAVIWSVGDTRHAPTEAPSPPAAIEYRLNPPGPGPAGNTDA